MRDSPITKRLVQHLGVPLGYGTVNAVFVADLTDFDNIPEVGFGPEKQQGVVLRKCICPAGGQT